MGRRSNQPLPAQSLSIQWWTRSIRIVVLGQGGAGKSTLSRKLAAATGTEWVEVDQLFWQTDIEPMPKPRWRILQECKLSEGNWIADRDLGPYDDVEVRLRLAEAVGIMDLALRRCVEIVASFSRANRLLEVDAPLAPQVSPVLAANHRRTGSPRAHRCSN
jgi:hypothetical protein